MLANIEEPIVAAVLSAVAVVGWIVCVQYSKYIEHQKKHVSDEEGPEKDLGKKFAFIPYFIIPIIFGALAVAAGMFAGDVATGREYIAGAEEITAFCTVASVIAYAVLDWCIVGKVGDFTYFKAIESKIFQSAPEVVEEVEDDPETAALKKKLAMLKELGLL